MVDVLANWRAVQDRIAEAAQRSGRSPDAIEVVAVTKGVPVEVISPLIKSGIAAIGENRVQEARAKYAAADWRDQIQWHFIGHLQTNKVKQCLEIADLIHSVDSLRLLQEINRRAEAMDLDQVRVLLQVSVSGENTKFGFVPSEVPKVLEEAVSCQRVVIQGLMTMAPFEEDPERTRPVFRRLRLLGEKLEQKGFPGFEMKYLSMGMTNDFDIAVEEGANLLRIGSGIFGHR